ncbi:MAG: hypothetical protein AAFW75_10825 [Cyanobacteria bacterium J06636_16]
MIATYLLAIALTSASLILFTTQHPTPKPASNNDYRTTTPPTYDNW